MATESDLYLGFSRYETSPDNIHAITTRGNALTGLYLIYA
jgi:hypothetical protein